MLLNTICCLKLIAIFDCVIHKTVRGLHENFNSFTNETSNLSHTKILVDFRIDIAMRLLCTCKYECLHK